MFTFLYSTNLFFRNQIPARTFLSPGAQGSQPWHRVVAYLSLMATWPPARPATSRGLLGKQFPQPALCPADQMVRPPCTGTSVAPCCAGSISTRP